MDARRDEIWAALLDNRDRAMRVALARCGSRDEVDDCVQEAMTRVAAMHDVDVARVGPLLTAVVSNLAVDGHRARARAVRNLHRVVPPSLPGPDEEVCDVAEARWLWAQRGALAERDRRVLDLRVADRSVGDAARELGITYKSAEHALARARGCLKAAWRATAALVGVLWGSRLRRAVTGPAVALSPAALTFVMALAISAAGGPGPSGDIGTGRMTQADAAAPAAPGPALPRATRATRASLPAQRTGRDARPVRPVPPHERTVARTREVRAGGLRVYSGPVTQSSEDETPVESAERCIREGPIVTTTYVGCPE